MPDTSAEPAAAAAAPPPPPPGEVGAVQPGLLRARMPLPFPPSHVNIWFLEHEGGWLAVDTSVSNRTTRELWDRVLASPELGGKPLTALLVTHFHPDHIGLTGWLCGRFGVLPHMTRIEWLMARALWYDSGPGHDGAADRALRPRRLPGGAPRLRGGQGRALPARGRRAAALLPRAPQRPRRCGSAARSGR